MINSRVRTNSPAKKPKLKWWYVVPIVLFVAFVGYVVIIYSKASDRFAEKSLNNKGLLGGTSSVAGTKSEPGRRLVGSTPVYAVFTAKEMSSAKKICAGINLESVSSGKLTLAANSSVVGVTSNEQQTIIDPTINQPGNNEVCIKIEPVLQTLAQSYGAKATVSQSTGRISVIEIWLQSD